MANIKLVVLTILAIVEISDSASSSAKMKARSSPLVRETVLPNTDTRPYITAVNIKGCSECIGTIIDESWILCSASCASKIEYKKDVKVIAGVSDLGGNLEGGQFRGIKTGFIKPYAHPDNCNANNMALLQLDYPLDIYTKNVQKINLPDFNARATIDNSYIVPYWEYYVCTNDPQIFHPLVELNVTRVESSLCRPKGYDTCSDDVVCIESIGEYVGPLMGPSARADEYDQKASVLHAISIDLDLVLSDGYTPDPYHDAQVPLTYENLKWIHTTMNYPEPQPIG